MSQLRQQMIRVLQLHRLSDATIEAYTSAVADLACFYDLAPDRLTREQVCDFFHHLITVRKLAYSTCNQKLCGINFFYRHVLGQADFQLKIPHKRGGHLPVPLSRSEISTLFTATANLKHRLMLMTAYGGGLPLPTIQRLMGHRSLSTTAKYLHVTNRHVDGIRSPLDLLRRPDEDDC